MGVLAALNTENRDRVIELWEPLPPFPGTLLPRVCSTNMNRYLVLNASPRVLHRVIGCVTYDMARLADGRKIRRPDILAELCFLLQECPEKLEESLENAQQQDCFLDLLRRTIAYEWYILEGEVRTPWNDEDFRFFGKKLLEKVAAAKASLK